MDAMTKRYLTTICLAIVIAVCSQQATAATPGLWDGAAAMPPQTLFVPEKDLDPGSFKYVPLSPIYFDSDKATLTYEGQQSLDAAVDYLLKHDNIQRILVEAHTDEKGARTYNDGLSDRRANIVRNYLTVKGVDPNLINVIGKGEYHPVDENWTREGRQRNRHVSIYAVLWDR